MSNPFVQPESHNKIGTFVKGTMTLSIKVLSLRVLLFYFVNHKIEKNAVQCAAKSAKSVKCATTRKQMEQRKEDVNLKGIRVQNASDSSASATLT